MGECDYNLYCIVLLGWAVIVGIHESFVFMWHHLSLVMNLIQTFAAVAVPLGQISYSSHFSFFQYKIKDNRSLIMRNRQISTSDKGWFNKKESDIGLAFARHLIGVYSCILSKI